MARWTPERREQTRTRVLTLLRDGKSFADACWRSNVSEMTVKRWVKNVPEFGRAFEEARRTGAPLRPKSNSWRNYAARKL